MKIRALVFCLLSVLMVSLVPIHAETDFSMAEMDFYAKKYVMMLNQQPIKLEISPIWDSKNNTLLIPLRFIAEMNRFSVGWDAKTNKATFYKAGFEFSITMQYPDIHLQSADLSSNYQIQLRSGRFLLDHRSIEKLLGITSELFADNFEVVFYTNRDEVLYVAPKFTLQDLHNKPKDLQTILDSPATKLVILNFYSTRCPICEKALPNLQKLHQDYLERGIVVLGINTDTKNMEAWRDEIISKYGLTYPILLDPTADVYTAYSVAGIPNLYVINKKREIIQHRLGVDDSYFVFLRKYLETYLNH